MYALDKDGHIHRFMSHDQGKTWHWTGSTADKKVPLNFAQEQLTDIKRLYKDKPFNVDFDLGAGSHRTRDGSVTLSGQHHGLYYALHGDSHRTRGISARSERVFNYTSLSGAKSTNIPASEKDGFHRDNTSIRLGFDDGQKGVDFLASYSSQTVHFDNSAENERAFDDHTRTRETR